VLAAITLPLGYTSSKEYAELEWPIDILITVVWVTYAVVFFGTMCQAQDQAHLCGQLVLRRLHHHGCGAAHRQQHGMPVSCSSPTPCMPVQWMPWCSGGTATTRWVSS
jgi:hypothetical protein